MVVSRKYLLLGLLYAFISMSCFGQTKRVFPDFGHWNTISVEYKMKNVELGLDQEWRIRDEYRRLNLFYTQPSVAYNIKKWFKSTLSYRFTQKLRNEDSFSYRHRFQWDIYLKEKIKEIGIGYRSRIQTEWIDLNVSELGNIPQWYWRHKIDLKYNGFKKWTPYLGIEFRYQIKDPLNEEYDLGWRRARFFVGVEYKINKHHRIDMFYLTQQEFEISTPNELYISGLQYTYTFKKKKDKE